MDKKKKNEKNKIMKYSFYFVQVLLGLALFVLLFAKTDELMRRKSLSGAWDMTNKIGGFYNEKPDDIDVLFLGSSHAYCSFNPLVLYEETGIKSYVFATQLQPFSANYYYLEEALKTQKPKLVVLEVFSGVFEYELDEGIIHSFTDDMPLSLNKVKMIVNSTDKDVWAENIFTIIKYHSRWNELEDYDYTYDKDDLRDYLKGHVALPDTAENLEIREVDFIGFNRLNEEDDKYFSKIIGLLKEKDIDLLIVKTPTTDFAAYQKKVNFIGEISSKACVGFVDCNSPEFYYKPDIKTDFYDKRHLNIKGSDKFTRAFKDEILKFVEPRDRDDELWNEDLKRYKAEIRN